MKQLFSVSIVIVSLLCVAAMAWAVKVPNLYQTEVLVPSQAPQYRQEAMKQSLKQILIRATGDGNILEDDKIKDALSLAQDYLIDYGYKQAMLSDVQTPAKNNIEMFTRFNPKLINQLIEKAGFKIWGQDRPLVLVWIAVSRYNDYPQLLGLYGSDVIVKELKQDMHARGLPIILPALDVVDSTKIKPSDIWQLNYRAILDASARYRSNAELIIKLSQADANHWIATGDVMLNNNIMNYDASAATSNEALAAIIDEATNAIAKNYIDNDDSLASQLVLTITNVNSVVDYAKVLKYLQSFNQIKDVQVHLVANGKVELVLDIDGGQPALDKLLSLDSKLLLKPKKTDSVDNPTKSVFYEWHSTT